LGIGDWGLGLGGWGGGAGGPRPRPRSPHATPHHQIENFY